MKDSGGVAEATCQRDIPTDTHGETYRLCGQPAIALVSSRGVIWLQSCKYHLGVARRDGWHTRKN